MNDTGSRLLSHDPDLPDGEKANLISNAISRSFVEAQSLSGSATRGPAINSWLYHISCRAYAEAILNAILTYRYPTDTNILNNIRIITNDQPTHDCFAQVMNERQAAMESENAENATIPLSTSSGPSDTRNVPTPTQATGMYLTIC